MVSFILQKLAHSVSWANSVRSRGWNFCRNSGLVSFINSGAAEIPSARLTGPFGYARLRENESCLSFSVRRAENGHVMSNENKFPLKKN